MDQLGSTEPTTEEQGSKDQQPDGSTGEADASRAACTLSVYRAELAAGPTESAERAEAAAAGTSTSSGSPDNDAEAAPAGPAAADGAIPVGSPDSGYPDGFTGTLALQNLEAFDEQMVGEALSRMAHLMSWVQALEARLLNRMEEIFREDFHAASGRLEPGMAFSLAASECAAILNIPQVTAQRMMFEAGKLCGTHAVTLAGLEEGSLSYQHAQVVLDQCQNVPPGQLPEFEADLLAAAEGQTRAQFSCKARRLRERKFPDTVSKQHQSAFEQRKVTLDREEDGMSWLSAHLRAEDAQQIYTTLSTAAQGEQTAGDSRTTDQLRADILAQLLMGGTGAPRVRGIGGVGRSVRSDGAGRTGCDDSEIVPRAEIMVLINAETLFGADDRPAELHGYGPISAEAARRLARNAAGWTGLAQDPQTGEILGVGRRRKVPAGLRRWLRARDGTCRFPGCRVSTANADIDHTVEWARGGPTDHGNLEHLCRRHHRFKTLGFWKACQPTPGVLEWTSPTGRIYRTEPLLKLEPLHLASEPRIEHKQTAPRQEAIPPF